MVDARWNVGLHMGTGSQRFGVRVDAGLPSLYNRWSAAGAICSRLWAWGSVFYMHTNEHFDALPCDSHLYS